MCTSQVDLSVSSEILSVYSLLTISVGKGNKTFSQIVLWIVPKTLVLVFVIDRWAAFSIETFANVLQNFLSLVHNCCGTLANCFDTERSLVLISPASDLFPEAER